MNRQERTITFRRVVDLTHPIRPGIPAWPGDPEVRFETTATLTEDGYFLRRFSMGEHSGTHLSAPSAFLDEGTGPDAMSPDDLIVPAVVIDARVHAGEDPDYTLTLDDLKDWERRNGKIPSGSIVLMLTGWHRYWDEPDRFINMGADGIMHAPGFSVEAARFLLDEREAAGIGIDTHGVDAGTDTALEVSRAFARRGGVILECLNNLDKLPATRTTLVIGRLPLAGGSGSPASVLALAP